MTHRDKEPGQLYSKTKAVGSMVYSWIKEMGLSNLNRSGLCSGTIIKLSSSRERKIQ